MLPAPAQTRGCLLRAAALRRTDLTGFVRQCSLSAARSDFLHRYAHKNHEMGGAKVFPAIDGADNRTILGYYSLSPASIGYARTPESVRRRLARHDVPAFHKGTGSGGQEVRPA